MIDGSPVTASPAREPNLIHFTGVTLDLQAGELRRGAETLPLRPKAFDVLVYFVRRPRQLLSKSELLRAVWPGVNVTDDSLVQCLVEIRRAFGDADPITTVRGRGYRFDAEVEVDGRVALPAPSTVPRPTGDTAVADDHRPARSGESPAETMRGLRSPFVLAGGAALVAAVAVTGWWSVGRSTAGGDMVRPVGSDSVDSVAVTLHAAGRLHLDTQTRVSLLQAVSSFEQAIERDPQYASAWAGLSHALTVLHIYGAAASGATLPRAKQAAQRAIALDPTLADAHTALAHVVEQLDRDWALVEASHRRALALSPENGRLHAAYALFLVSQLRTEEALAASARAISLQPGMSRPVILRAVVLSMAGRDADAIELLEHGGAATATHNLARYWRAVALMNLGQFDLAQTEALAARADAANEPTVLLGVIHARAGRRAEALEVRRALADKATATYVPPTDFAAIDTALGHDDAALAWLERGEVTHARYMAGINVHPLFRTLRGNPRFIALTKRLGLKLPKARVSASHLPPS